MDISRLFQLPMVIYAIVLCMNRSKKKEKIFFIIQGILIIGLMLNKGLFIESIVSIMTFVGAIILDKCFWDRNEEYIEREELLLEIIVYIIFEIFMIFAVNNILINNDIGEIVIFSICIYFLDSLMIVRGCYLSIKKMKNLGKQ